MRSSSGHVQHTLCLSLLMTPVICDRSHSFLFSESCSEVSVLLRCGVSAWNIKINEHKTQVVYFLIDLVTLRLIIFKGRNIPFVNHVKSLGVIFDKRIAWRLHIEMFAIKAFRTIIRIYSLFKSERLSANIKLTLQKALIRSVMS
jgi:hypothetical protein